MTGAGEQVLASISFLPIKIRIDAASTDTEGGVKEGDGVRIGYCCGPTGGWCGGVQILVCVCILNVCNFKTNCQPSPAAGAGLVKTSRATSSSCQLLPEPELLTVLMLTNSVLQF